MITFLVGIGFQPVYSSLATPNCAFEFAIYSFKLSVYRTVALILALFPHNFVYSSGISAAYHLVIFTLLHYGV
jgi:hypothetical protein